MYKRIILFIFLLALFLAMKHPLHISVTNIDYNKEKKFLEIAVKMFPDDLAAAVEKKGKKKINFNSTNSEEEKNNLTIINNYFSEHFSVEINKGTIKFSNFEFVQKKINTENIWLYYRIPYAKKIRQLRIMNSLLTDVFSDQTNLLIVTCDGVEKGFNLNTKEITAEIKF